MSQIQEEIKTRSLRKAFAEGLMTLLGFAVWILLLPLGIILWQYDRHIKV